MLLFSQPSIKDFICMCVCEYMGVLYMYICIYTLLNNTKENNLRWGIRRISTIVLIVQIQKTE